MNDGSSMFPLPDKDGEPGKDVPDAWPAQEDLRWVAERTSAAVAAVSELSLVLVRLRRLSDGIPPRRLTQAEYGSLSLFLDAMKQDGDTIARDAKDMADTLDEQKWEAVDLDA